MASAFDPSISKIRLSPRFSPVFQGVLSALLCWFTLRDLGILDLFPLWRGATATVFGAAALGAALGLTRARALVGIGALFSLILWLVVAFTPLASVCARSLLAGPVSNGAGVAQADAIVVLLAKIQRDDDFGTPSLERTLHGLELAHARRAPRLVITQAHWPDGSHRVAASRLMKNLGVSCALEVVGPVRDTHDEALAVRALSRRQGWNRILLVTSPLHSHRAALVFAKTGLSVVEAPCRETSYDLENLIAPGDRIKAFSAAIHEIIGLRAYRARGWI